MSPSVSWPIGSGWTCWTADREPTLTETLSADREHPTEPDPTALAKMLDVTPAGSHEWRGNAEIGSSRRLFGGQVIAQALVAAAADVSNADFAPRSVHAHFLRAGAPDLPVYYRVESLTDGRSFATRQVLAVQRPAGEPERIIAVAIAAFHRPETSTEHQTPMPQTAQPEDLESERVAPARTNPRVRLPFDLRTVPEDRDRPGSAARIQVWVRTRRALPPEPILQAAALVWIADFSLPWATDGPHAHEAGTRTGSSLDHTLWFHRPMTVTDWLFFDQVSPVYTGARGLAVGHFYTRDGAMVATAIQESLIRRA